MRAYFIYFFLAILVSLMSFSTYRVIYLKEFLIKEKARIISMKKELEIRRLKIRILKDRIRKERIPLIDKKEALKIVYETVDSLKKNAQVVIKSNIIEENNLWKIKLSLKFEPKNNEEIISMIRKLLNMKSPLVRIEYIEIDNSAKTKVSIDIELIQPFLL